MKPNKFLFFVLVGLAALCSSCSDELERTNPNQQTTADFGDDVDELEECVIAGYNHLRMGGSFGRTAYTFDVSRGDEVWNSSQVWYLPFDDLDVEISNDIADGPWMDMYYTVNVVNFILKKVTGENSELSTDLKRIKGQALFLRGFVYYVLAGYYQNPPLITDYDTYSTLDGLYVASTDYDVVLDQVEADLLEAIDLLPSKSEGGEWAGGRATSGAAAGYYACTLMARHKYSEALTYLRNIINGQYGTYRLMDNYGDNFQEGSAYENNDESIFEIQYLDYGSQGTDDEWTPVNVSVNATQGHSVESNYCPADFGGWADLSISPWLYNLFKEEKTTSGTLDPRLYWTAGTYEPEWADFEYGNVAYTTDITGNDDLVTNNNYGGIPIAKYTNMRTGLYSAVTTGLRCGINQRMLRYADILLRAAECENEISGPTQQAISWINQVRNRADLASLNLSDFSGNADKLFEQIANVERPKELGCEFGRGYDLIRWGFFLTSDRLQQLKEHGTFRRSPSNPKAAVSYSDIASDSELKSSFDTYVQGHEFFPITDELLSDNPNLEGNSANNNTSNLSYFQENGWTIHPVVDLDN